MVLGGFRSFHVAVAVDVFEVVVDIFEMVVDGCKWL